jgi:hypothetical protein
MDSGIIEAASLLFADIATAAQEGSRILKEITSRNMRLIVMFSLFFVPEQRAGTCKMSSPGQ